MALLEELRRSGFVEGQNLIVDQRGFSTDYDKFPEVAAAIIKSPVDAIVCSGEIALKAAQQATRTIPILGVADDMLAAGLVRSLARPGGNTTGISILATELDGKRQELLMEVVPKARRMAASPIPTQPKPGGSKRSKMQRARPTSNFRYTWSTMRRKSFRQSMRQRLLGRRR
jgi:ABC-type uncharacterized transport system substrate-binding protein